MTKAKYNTTQLYPEQTFERHVFHRDQFAHYLRWTHVLYSAKIGQRILDWGCGNGNLAEVLYRNKYKASEYLGLEYKKTMVDACKKRFEGIDWIKFEQQDLVNMSKNFGKDWDIIACFEVTEHVGKANVPAFLDNIAHHCGDKTLVLLSTPVFDEKTGAANNHIVDGVVGEFTYNELQDLLVERFDIESTFGTFASQKDYKQLMNDWQKKMFEGLSRYYDSNLVSNFMAPFFPEQSRNCLWRMHAMKK